ncbi:hypothetical protein [Methylobacterium sp. GC_Met_2]|uniref:hypothetical protein n=1 Tax=Methylobacterium sp. GC_Met_2 TaxID=2937376 RepID=UPI00226BA03C|nr:hypothetical protein [Methylobacterium sp. GC_Met_2]
MSLRTSLQKLIRRDPDASLRERAASLQTDLTRVARPPVAEAAEPETAPNPRDAELLTLQPEWEACAAVYMQALEEQGVISDNAPNVEAPPPREPFQDWARLIPGWRERTGVDAAEAATAEAMGALCEIENRIANMPAATLAGLKLKARVAQRNEDVSWPEGLEESLVRDILAIGEPEIEADADLLRLGRQFEAARAREKAACEACNAAQDEARRHMPERPAALLFQASDHPLRLGKYLTHPDHLEGTEVTSEDIAWMKRKPYVREVRRPVRPEDNLPSDARAVVDTFPWPEAQDRADEIVTAWEAWHAERLRIYSAHVTDALDTAANDAGDVAATLACRIAVLPALTAAGFRVKLHALCSYDRKALLSDVPDEPDPDQLLSHSLWQDVRGERQAAAQPVDWYDPPPGFMAAPAIEPFSFTQIHNGIAMELARLRGIAVAEFARLTGPTTAAKDIERIRRDLHLDILDPASSLRVPAALTDVPSLICMLDLASATMKELGDIQDMAEHVGAVAYAYTWGARCRRRENHYGAPEYNDLGKLMVWLGDALTSVDSAVDKEAARRLPDNSADRETRLLLRARPIIDNGDPDAIEVFARELLAHAEAERAGR